MPFFRQITSIHGRRLGLSSTGGILASTGSTEFDAVAVMRDSTGARLGPLYEPLTAVASSIGSTIGHGFSTISSGTATAPSFEISEPVVGVEVEIHIDTSASEMTFGSCTTAIVFRTTLSGEASTMFFSALADVDLFGVSLTLRGITTTQWNVKSLNLNPISAVASTLGTNLVIG